MRFVDTNVLLYAISSDPSEVDKSARAAALLQETDLALSVQVLQEFYVQATRTSRSAPLTHETATSFLATLERLPIQDLTLAVVHSALHAARRWRLVYWDAATSNLRASSGATSSVPRTCSTGRISTAYAWSTRSADGAPRRRPLSVRRWCTSAERTEATGAQRSHRAAESHRTPRLPRHVDRSPG